jgi:pimeloyl-ACP methyl ester carboxylesterase
MQPVVVFLHGLGRTHRSLEGLRRAVADAGHETWAETYPSREMVIAELAAQMAARIREALPGRELVAVTHSLGGILVRHMRELLPWKGAVMLAPPNQGSRVAHRLSAESRLVRWLMGPTIVELGDPAGWPAPPEPFGVIAGTSGATIGNPPSWVIEAKKIHPPDAPHDGTVAVAETRLDGMAAFATVAASHTWIMDHPETRRLVLDFLREGRFSAASSAAEGEG